MVEHRFDAKASSRNGGNLKRSFQTQMGVASCFVGGATWAGSHPFPRLIMIRWSVLLDGNRISSTTVAEASRHWGLIYVSQRDVVARS